MSTVNKVKNDFTQFYHKILYRNDYHPKTLEIVFTLWSKKLKRQNFIFWIFRFRFNRYSSKELICSSVFWNRRVKKFSINFDEFNERWRKSKEKTQTKPTTNTTACGSIFWRPSVRLPTILVSIPFWIHL